MNVLPTSVERCDGAWASIGVCTAMGRRQNNEDAYVLQCDGLDGCGAEKAPTVVPSSRTGGGLFDDLPELVSGPSLPAKDDKSSQDCLLAVFDGHGGAGAAKLCAQRLSAALFEQLEAAGRDTPEARRTAAESVCLELDRYLRIKLGAAACSFMGTTCVFAFVWQDVDDEGGTFRVLLCNLGDSRGVVIGSSSADSSLRLVGETNDHKPEVAAEVKRIQAAGGQVDSNKWDRGKKARVDGMLACSRALGDFYYKDEAHLLPEQQKVSNQPDIFEFRCRYGDAVILACDGVFDVLSSEEVRAIVAKVLQKSDDPQAAAKAVVEAALKHPQNEDNCTCAVFRT